MSAAGQEGLSGGGGGLCSLECPLCSVLGSGLSLFSASVGGAGGGCLSCSLGATRHSRAAWTLAPGRDILTSRKDRSLGPACLSQPDSVEQTPRDRGSGPWRVWLGPSLLRAGPGQATGILGLERH